MKSARLSRTELVPLVMLSIALAIRQMSMTMVMPFISTYCRALSGYTPVLAGVVIGAFGLMQAVFQIPFGLLSDRYGNKPLVLIGLAMVIAGLVLAWAARDIWLLVLARALQGSGAIIGVAYSWAAGMVTGDKRLGAMGILGAFISAAAALAFAIGPLLRSVMTVSTMFLGSALLLTLNALYILAFLKDSRGGQADAVPSRNAFRLLLHNGAFVRMNLAAFINNFMMIAVFYGLPFYLTRVTGETGMWKVFMPAILVAVLAMKAALPLAARDDGRPVMIVSFLVASVSLLLFLDRTSFPALLAGTVLFMCGYITLTTLVATRVNGIVEDGYRGTANGIFNAFQYVGNFAGAVVAGSLWEVSERLTWLILAGTGIAGALIVSKTEHADEKADTGCCGGADPEARPEEVHH